MAQTQRTITDIYTILADNTGGGVSPQDLRDALESWRPTHGQIYVDPTNSGSITPADTTNFFEATTPVWTLSNAHNWDESAGNGRLTYTGTVAVTAHIALSFCTTASGVNKVISYRIGKNGTADVRSEITRTVGTGSDFSAVACHLIEDFSTGDYVSVWIRNQTTATDVTIESANLQLMTMPK